MIRRHRETAPSVDESAFVADTALVIGDVTLAPESSVWFGAVVRGDCAPIYLGPRSNVQDNAVLHTSIEHPVKIGTDVTIGHCAVVHGATVEDGVLIGMNATVLDGAHIGTGSIIGAGALVLEGADIPPHSLAVGVPARIARTLSDERLSENV